MPLLRPAMATVAVFTMIPVWNDLWFPLLLAPTGELLAVLRTHGWDSMHFSVLDPEEFAAQIRAEFDVYKRVVAQQKLTLE